MKRLLPLLLLLSACSQSRALHPPDPVRGESLFGTCSGCHSLQPGVTVFGPSLSGVYGRRAGSLSGYDYSPAMRAYGRNGQIWDDRTLDVFLTSPARTVPGTRMGFWGYGNPQDRRDLIAYLKTR